MDETTNFLLKWENFDFVWGINFYRLMEKNKYCDAKFLVEGRLICCHRVILAASSSFFDDLFNQFPSQSAEIVLSDVSFLDMLRVLHYVYKSQVAVPRESFKAFMQVAKKLKLKGLMDKNDDPDYFEAIHPKFIGTPPISPKLANIPDDEKKSLWDEAYGTEDNSAMLLVSTHFGDTEGRESLNAEEILLHNQGHLMSFLADQSPVEEKGPLKKKRRLNEDESPSPVSTIIVEKYPCQFCGNKYSKKSLKPHMKTCKLNPERETFECIMCNVQYFTKKSLASHIIKEHKQVGI